MAGKVDLYLDHISRRSLTEDTVFVCDTKQIGEDETYGITLLSRLILWLEDL